MAFDDLDYKYTKAQEAFIAWMEKQGYEPAVEICPVDSGDYLFATESHWLVEDFKSENPEYAKTPNSEIEIIGDGRWDQVSDFLSDKEHEFDSQLELETEKESP